MVWGGMGVVWDLWWCGVRLVVGQCGGCVGWYGDGVGGGVGVGMEVVRGWHWMYGEGWS